jgi:hypothetical protein
MPSRPASNIEEHRARESAGGVACNSAHPLQERRNTYCVPPRSTLLDLEAQAKAEKEAIAAIVREASEPIHLPSPAQLEKGVYDIDARLHQDPLAARELLRRLFKDGRVVLEPQPDRIYLARTEVLPLLLLSEGVRDHGGPRLLPGAAVFP